MQTLTAPPRAAYSNDQLTALLQSSDLLMAPGVELLDTSDNFVSDLSDFMGTDGTTSRDCTAKVHGSLTVSLSYPLVWGRDRLRPYVLCSSRLLGLSGVRFNLGVFIATSPARKLGEVDAATGLPISTFSVTGYDKLYIVDQQVGDAVVVGQGADVLLQVGNFITEATSGDTKISLDGAAAGSLLASDIVWPLGGSAATFLDIINDLLSAINYIPLWTDSDGYFRSGPYVDPATASPEWTFDVQDARRNIIADPREVTYDTWGVPNWWRFTQNGLNVAPVEGAGQFTYADNSASLTGFGTRGYYVRRVIALDAVDQVTLQALAQQQIIADTNIAEMWSLPSGPLPQSGHNDIVLYKDTDIDGGVTSRKCQVQSWVFHFDGSEMDRTMKSALTVNL